MIAWYLNTLGLKKTPSVYIGALLATFVNKAANINYFLLVNKIENYVIFESLAILIKTLGGCSAQLQQPRIRDEEQF